MSVVRTIGKNTIGDNDKMKVAMRDYEMSSHDLSFIWRNTQSPGTLVPFMKIYGQKGDIFDIDLNSKALTHPTVGPLFGAYKLQHFVFTCPIRLYNSWLHNNRLGVGLKMKEVKLPTYEYPRMSNTDIRPVNSSSLISYLGYKGQLSIGSSNKKLSTSKNGLPILMYWDIFKNYFANTQEKYAYMIGASAMPRRWSLTAYGTEGIYTAENGKQFPEGDGIWWGTNNKVKIIDTVPENNYTTTWTKTYFTFELFKADKNQNNQSIGRRTWAGSLLASTITGQEITTDLLTTELTNANATSALLVKIETVGIDPVGLERFELEDIDKMRDELLATAGNTYANICTKGQLSPIFKQRTLEEWRQPQFGLALKTYDSDIFMNWVNTEYIDGEGGINDISAAAIVDGKLSMDTLNLSRKVYNMLNRIAVSGGTYRDWLDTVYTAGSYLERPETPIFEGGISQIIEFQEVVSTSAAADEPLGTLAGRGRTTSQRGSGKLHFKVTEPSYIIGICAITPLVDYSQGNDWDLDILTMDDWHKPALDGIGYQDSINDQRAWFAGYWNENTQKEVRKSAGKQVAWINYMTNFNRTFGNFAAGESEAFMCLNKYYHPDTLNHDIKNLTTYIDPSEHNEIFADTELSAMNFWIQTACRIIKRGNYSAKQIPNL